MEVNGSGSIRTRECVPGEQLVCSPRPVAGERRAALPLPGDCPAGAAAHDQARTATPEEALRAGADLLVIGRPITSAPDPGAAAAAIAAPLRRLTPAAG